MRQCRLHALAVVLIVLSGAACGTSAPTVAPTPAGASFEEYETGVCSAFGAMLRAVGNPDTGTPSVLSKSLDDAVAAGDVAASDRAAAKVTSELETGRQQAAAAGRWPPAQPTMAAMDTLFVAFEAMTTAKLAAVRHTPGAVAPQSALEQAGGVQAWAATVQGISTMQPPAGASPKPCPAFSGTP
jgi:hypothetical protein